MVAQLFQFSLYYTFGEIMTGSPYRGVEYRCVAYINFAIFDQYLAVCEPIQDRDVLLLNDNSFIEP